MVNTRWLGCFLGWFGAKREKFGVGCSPSYHGTRSCTRNRPRVSRWSIPSPGNSAGGHSPSCGSPLVPGHPKPPGCPQRRCLPGCCPGGVSPGGHPLSQQSHRALWEGSSALCHLGGKGRAGGPRVPSTHPRPTWCCVLRPFGFWEPPEGSFPAHPQPGGHVGWKGWHPDHGMCPLTPKRHQWLLLPEHPWVLRSLPSSWVPAGSPHGGRAHLATVSL